MNKLTLIGIALVASLIVGCGGGSGGTDTGGTDTGGTDTGGTDTGGTDTGGTDTGGTDTGGTDTGGTDTGGSTTVYSASPVVPLDKVTITNNITGTNLVSKAGYDGDIIVVEESSDITFEGSVLNIKSLQIKLKDSVPSLNVVDLQKEFTYSLNCTENVTFDGQTIKSGSVNETYNYKTGKVTTLASGDAQSFACASTFTSPLPTTVTSADSSDFDSNDTLLGLLKNWGDDDTGLITTSCPDSSETDDSDVIMTQEEALAELEKTINELANLVNKCDYTHVTNYTVTDDTGKVHRVAIEGGSIPLGFLLLLLAPVLLRIRKIK